MLFSQCQVGVQPHIFLVKRLESFTLRNAAVQMPRENLDSAAVFPEDKVVCGGSFAWCLKSQKGPCS